MIVISGALVLVALVLLVVGLTMTDLPFVYGSIAVSLLALVFLVLGILQRRNEQLPAASGAAPAPGPTLPPAPTAAIPAADLRKPATASVRLEEEPPVEAELETQGGGFVLVVPGRPRYHAEGCRYLAGKDVEEVDVLDARDEGFTPCGVCKPDAVLAARVDLDAEALEEIVTEDSEQALDAADIPAVEPAERDARAPEPDEEPVAVDEIAVDNEIAADGEEIAVVAPAEVPVDETLDGAGPAAPLLPAEEPRRRGSKAAAPAPARKTAARSATRVVPDAAAAAAAPAAPAKAPRKRAAAAVAAAPAAPARTAAKAPGRTRSAATTTPDVATPTRSARKAPGAVVEVAPTAAPAPAKKAARAAAVATPAGAAATKRGTVVVIPDRGRFHRAECRYVRGADDAVELTKAAASRQGYEACGVCRP